MLRSNSVIVAVGLCLASLADVGWAQIQVPTTVQLPTFGVAIDAEGVLSTRSFPDPGGRLFARRALAARAALPRELFAKSPMRMISLRRLEQAISELAAEGKPPTETMRHLAGLVRIQYVFCFPEKRDIVIAGPAEGWVQDASGRARGVATGRPIILLEDLVVALRTFGPTQPLEQFLGCSIDPDPQRLSDFQEFQRRVPRRVSTDQRGRVAAEIEKGIRDSLGMANIRLFGIDPQTHMGQVLVEADYRMKLIATGLEAPPVKMVTFISATRSATQSNLQRWWFTPNYDCVKTTEDRLSMELVGQGVQLQGEDKVIDAQGRLQPTNRRPGRASRLFTTAFTKKYPEIARASPVYGQLRNMIDLLVAAAFIRQQDYYAKADWSLGALADERQVPVKTAPHPKQVACVVNVLWKGNRLLAPAGGGVSIVVTEALKKERLMADSDQALARQRTPVADSIPETGWWWD